MTRAIFVIGVVVFASSCMTACGKSPDGNVVGDHVVTQDIVSSEDKVAYREAVIRSAALIPEDATGKIDEVERKRYSGMARDVYRALDEGPGSALTNEIGGIELVRKWVNRFELFHEYRPLRDCMRRVFDAQGGVMKPDVWNRIAAGSEYSSLTKDAISLAGVEYRSLLLSVSPSPSDAERARSAFAALMMRRQGEERQDLSAIAMVHAASGSEGKCTPSTKLMAMLASVRK